MLRSPGDDDFVAFATTAGPRLRRTAHLMCRDWHLAQDLTQTTLTRMYASWGRMRRVDDVDAYSRRVLVNALLDQRRRRSGSGRTSPGPDGPGRPGPGRRPDSIGGPMGPHAHHLEASFPMTATARSAAPRTTPRPPPAAGHTKLRFALSMTVNRPAYVAATYRPAKPTVRASDQPNVTPPATTAPGSAA